MTDQNSSVKFWSYSQWQSRLIGSRFRLSLAFGVYNDRVATSWCWFRLTLLSPLRFRYDQQTPVAVLSWGL